MICGIHYFSAEVKPKLMSSQGAALSYLTISIAFRPIAFHLFISFVFKKVEMLDLKHFKCRFAFATAQQTQNICITFVQCWTNVEDGPTLYKCYTNVLCLLGGGGGYENVPVCGVYPNSSQMFKGYHPLELEGPTCQSLVCQIGPFSSEEII